MLRIAVPNKGSLSEPAVTMLGESGYRERSDPRELVLQDPENDVEFFFLRPRDIAVYVGQGTVDAGITGRDLLLDSDAPAIEHLQLGFGPSTFRFAAPKNTISAISDVAGLRIATSYPVLVRRYLNERAIVPSDVVRLDGAVESAIQLGVADVIADVVSTGTTLRAAGLEVIGEPLLKSEAVLIRRDTVAVPEGVEVLTRRLQGVLVARQYVLIDYDIRHEDLDAAMKITPGLESPTVSPLHDSLWVAVRAMVPRAHTNRVMDELYAVGARAILVTSLHACRI